MKETLKLKDDDLESEIYGIFTLAPLVEEEQDGGTDRFLVDLL